VTRFRFVADHSDAFEVKRFCELVEIDRSSFYAWKAAAPARAAGAAADADLVAPLTATVVRALVEQTPVPEVARPFTPDRFERKTAWT
jgi:hypothetical protein